MGVAEETGIINNLSTLLLIVINAGCGLRMLFCAIMMNSNENEPVMKKRIRNTLIFCAVANCLIALNSLAQSYWG